MKNISKNILQTLIMLLFIGSSTLQAEETLSKTYAADTWYMLSSPCNDKHLNVKEFFGLEGEENKDWVVYAYKNGTGYELYNGLLKKGEGYWVIQTKKTFSVEYYPLCERPAPKFHTTIKKGWSLIGTGSSTNITVNDIKVNNGTQSVENNDGFENKVWVYREGKYEELSGEDVIYIDEAFWIHTKKESLDLSIGREVNNQSPAYGGNPSNIPGTVEAEEYDRGGEGEAYHDTDAENTGHVKNNISYRTQEGVDIASVKGVGYALGWVAAGEYTNYTVEVKKDGYYDVTANVASDMSGEFKVYLDNANISFSVNSTGGWDTWSTITKKGIYLKAGKQTMKIDIIVGAFNVDSLTFKEGNPSIDEGNEDNNFTQNPKPQNSGPILSQEYYDAVTSSFVPPTGYTKVAEYKFGTDSDRNIRNLTDLSKAFVPYLGDMGTGGLFANKDERARYDRVFEREYHEITRNSIRLYVRPGKNQALDSNGYIIQPTSKYAKDQWAKGAAIRVKDKFHKNAIFVVRAKFPHVVRGIFPAAWIVPGYTFWPLEVDIFESWYVEDNSHPMMQTDTGHNRGASMVYDNNWVTYQTAHRDWEKNDSTGKRVYGQRGHVIGKVDNWGQWIDIDAFCDTTHGNKFCTNEDTKKYWNRLAGVEDEIAVDHYTTSQVRVGGLDFSTQFIDHVSGVLDDLNSPDPAKGIATWWLGNKKTRTQHYWMNGDKEGKAKFSWKENDTLSIEANMILKGGNEEEYPRKIDPKSYPQWLEIQEIIVYEPSTVAFARHVTEPANDARVSSSPNRVKEGEQVTITVQWRNVKPNHRVEVYWADFWEKSNLDTGASWAKKKLLTFTPTKPSGNKEFTFTVNQAMLSGGDAGLVYNDKNKEHGYITVVIDEKEIRKNDALNIKSGLYAKSLILQDGIYYGTSDKNLIEDYEQY